MQRLSIALVVIAGGCVADPVSDSVVVVVDPAPTPTISAIHENPADFVLTPSGYYHKDCIIDVGDDATLETDGSVTLSDGTQFQIPECVHGHYASFEELRGAAGEALAIEPAVNGWVEDLRKRAAVWYKTFTATWSVPTNPSHVSNQVVFFFPAFLPYDDSTIIQPVLQFGSSAAGGGDYWSISSWDCNKSCPHSALKRVAVGDVIEGIAAGSNCSSGGACTWTITTKDKSSGVTATLTHKESKAMNFASVTLEAYNVSSCDEYPSSNKMAFDVTVENNKNASSTSTWVPQVPSHVPDCAYKVSSKDYSHVDLSWSGLSSGDSLNQP